MQFGQIQVVESDFEGCLKRTNTEQVSRNLDNAPRWNGKSRLYTLSMAWVRWRDGKWRRY